MQIVSQVFYASRLSRQWALLAILSLPFSHCLGQAVPDWTPTLPVTGDPAPEISTDTTTTVDVSQFAPSAGDWSDAESAAELQAPDYADFAAVSPVYHSRPGQTMRAMLNPANFGKFQFLIIHRGWHPTLLPAPPPGVKASDYKTRAEKAPDCPENSQCSIKVAYDQGIEAIELDLKTTKDHHIALGHDNAQGRQLNTWLYRPSGAQWAPTARYPYTDPPYSKVFGETKGLANANLLAFDLSKQDDLNPLLQSLNWSAVQKQFLRNQWLLPSTHREVDIFTSFLLLSKYYPAMQLWIDIKTLDDMLVFDSLLTEFSNKYNKPAYSDPSNADYAFYQAIHDPDSWYNNVGIKTSNFTELKMLKANSQGLIWCDLNLRHHYYYLANFGQQSVPALLGYYDNEKLSDGKPHTIAYKAAVAEVDINGYASTANNLTFVGYEAIDKEGTITGSRPKTMSLIIGALRSLDPTHAVADFSPQGEFRWWVQDPANKTKAKTLGKGGQRNGARNDASCCFALTDFLTAANTKYGVPAETTDNRSNFQQMIRSKRFPIITVDDATTAQAFAASLGLRNWRSVVRANAQSNSATVQDFADVTGDEAPTVIPPPSGDQLPNTLTAWNGSGTFYTGDDSGQIAEDIKWGQVGDVPIAGDFDGDFVPDYAIWRPSTGEWWVINSADGSQVHPVLGSAADTPTPGDFDGDYQTDLAVYHNNGHWTIIPSTTKGAYNVSWGAAGDIPVVGDFDGDGLSDIAVFRPSNGTWYVTLTNKSGTITKAFGTAGDVPLSGDYDGDGITDFAVWRPSNQTFYVLKSSSGTESTFQLGEAGDQPLAVDFDQDGITDFVLWRKSTGQWVVEGSSVGAETISGKPNYDAVSESNLP